MRLLLLVWRWVNLLPTFPILCRVPRQEPSNCQRRGLAVEFQKRWGASLVLHTLACLLAFPPASSCWWCLAPTAFVQHLLSVY